MVLNSLIEYENKVRTPDLKKPKMKPSRLESAIESVALIVFLFLTSNFFDQLPKKLVQRWRINGETYGEVAEY